MLGENFASASSGEEASPTSRGNGLPRCGREFKRKRMAVAQLKSTNASFGDYSEFWSIIPERRKDATGGGVVLTGAGMLNRENRRQR